MTNKIVIAYLLYLPIVLGLTHYVARTLFTNGRAFMLDIFKGREDIANATNKLFEVGFYLLNMGFAMRMLRIDEGVERQWDADLRTFEQVVTDPLNTNQRLVEVLAGKVGGFAIYLGIMLFLNLFLFFRGRRKAHRTDMPGAPAPVPVINAPAL
jgi:hypothetical protein